MGRAGGPSGNGLRLSTYITTLLLIHFDVEIRVCDISPAPFPPAHAPKGQVY